MAGHYAGKTFVVLATEVTRISRRQRGRFFRLQRPNNTVNVGLAPLTRAAAHIVPACLERLRAVMCFGFVMSEDQTG